MDDELKLVVQVNPAETPLSATADAVLRDKSGLVLPQLVRDLGFGTKGL